MLTTLVIFILMLGVIVLVHEFGHFYMARKNGVKVEEFGIGFPPKLFSVKRKDTVYAINLIPLGGYVKIKGEDGGNKDDKDSFSSKKIWQRIVIVSAGVVMNVILAMVLFSIGFMVGSPQVIDGQGSSARIRDTKIQIVQVLENSPADIAGMKTSDIILSIDGNKFEDEESLRNYISDNSEKEQIFLIKREGLEIEKKVKPEYIEEVGKKAAGIAFSKTGIVSYPWYIAIYEGIKYTFLLIGAIVVGFYELIRNLITHQAAGMQVAGPVGIASLTGKVARMGIVYFINFVALISVNLAVINFIPFPALDGGRVLFLIIEKIRKKPVSAKVENTIHTIGFALLMVLIIWVTIIDVSKFRDVFSGLMGKVIR